MVALERTGVVGVKLLYVAVVVTLVGGAASAAFLLTSHQAPVPKIVVESLWSDSVDAPVNEMVYLLGLNVSNPGSVPWRFDPALLLLVSNTTLSFSPYAGYNATTLMPGATIAPGKSAVGRVAFILPTTEVPSELRYHSTSSAMMPEVLPPIPPVSAVAYRFAWNARISANDIPVAAGGWTASECPTATVNGTGPWICSLILNGVVLNAPVTDAQNCASLINDKCDLSVVFFTGQTVEVNLWFEYLKKPADPQTVSLQSVSAGQGFQLVNVTKSLPMSVTGTALYDPEGQAGLDVYLKVLPGVHTPWISVSEWYSA